MMLRTVAFVALVAAAVLVLLGIMAEDGALDSLGGAVVAAIIAGICLYLARRGGGDRSH